MKIDILTLFPNMFSGPFDESMIKRAKDRGLVEINIHNLRDWGLGPHKIVDDRPYGGGVGMLLMIEPLYNAVTELKKNSDKPYIILTTPSGNRFTQAKARELVKKDHLIIVSGHYEGHDERITTLIDEEISIGDYILTGGELPAMVIAETVARLIPGVLNKPEATEKESFAEDNDSIVEHPHYTRPENFMGQSVPKVLLSGNHSEIEKWKREQALQKSSNRT